MSFFHYFFNINSAREEVAVCCPFPHYTPGAKIPYFETNASAHVNTVENVFHCKVCGEGYNELSFIRRILGCTYANAIRLAQVFHKTDEEDYLDWQENMKLTDTTRAQLHELGINDETIEELSIRSTRNDEIVFPVFMHNKLLDIRKYVPGGTPKVASRSGAIPGLIIPYDIWRNDPRHVTLICAGEKDMAVARSHGFNAITLTGGENMLPALLTCFKDKRLVIVYDNDGAGIDGANKLAAFLKPYAKTIKNCTAFHEVCSEPKEDITDFFTKYGKTKADLVKYIQQTPEFVIAPEMQVTHPTMTLHEATNPNHVGKMARSNIQVVATSEITFIIPQTLIGEKTNDPSEGDSGKMFKGEIREWNLTESTIQDVLHMMDNNFTLDALNKNYRRILGIMEKEKHVRIRKGPKEILHKCYVTDMFETANTEVVPMEYLAYSIGTKLESGKKYLATYKLVPHPYRGQQLVMLITSAEQANDSVSNFVITDKVKKDLDIFRNLEGTVEERINEHADRFKDILGYNGNNLLIQTIDLAYHTVLEFNFGQFKNIRGYLDTIIVGESRMGKSSTAEAMRKTYGLGTITSLAGNAATVPGLVGGSNKVGNSYQTRAGVIPQNHKGLIIFEEFGKSNGNIVKELTDIRSSNEVRITRVSGTLTLPALVRMIALTNVCTSDGNIRSIASYPNGITILTDLIGTGEDIARYDISLVLGDRGHSHVDPFWIPRESFDPSALRTKIRWVWSRKSTDVCIDRQVGNYIIESANALNNDYDSHIKLFGTEAWKKLARLSIAIAGYLVSTDETYEHIIVEKEHVDYAVKYFRMIYDNDVFRLKEYVEHERKYSTIDGDGIKLLQNLYAKSPALLLHLEQVATTTKNTLQAVTGMNNDDYNACMNSLVAGMFVTFTRYDIQPTERFRLGMGQINRAVHIPKVGEQQ